MKKLPQLNKRTNKISISLSGFNRCICACGDCVCPPLQPGQAGAVSNINGFGSQAVQWMQG